MFIYVLTSTSSLGISMRLWAVTRARRYTHTHSLSLTLSLTHTQGFCTPPDSIEVDEQSGGTEFVDIEGGGFDEGEGTKNVSNEVDPSNLVSHTFLVTSCYLHRVHTTTCNTQAVWVCACMHVGRFVAPKLLFIDLWFSILCVSESIPFWCICTTATLRLLYILLVGY